MKAKHIVSCGVKTRENEKSWTVEALCLQTSSLKSPPHVIIFPYRHSLNNLEDVSCTDSKKQWEKLKNNYKYLYESMPISQLCLKRPVKNFSVSPNTREEFQKILLNTVSESSLFKHLEGRKMLSSQNNLISFQCQIKFYPFLFKFM